MKAFLTSLFVIFFQGVVLFAQNTPIIGETKTITTTVCRIDVDARGKENIGHVYAAPAGWQILTFTPVVISKRQYAAYNFSQTPSNFVSLNKTIIERKLNELTQLAAQKNVAQKYEGQIKQIKESFEKFYRMEAATHSKISTTGQVKGNGKHFGKPGRLYLDLEITLIYLPDEEEQFLQSLAYLEQIITVEN